MINLIKAFKMPTLFWWVDHYINLMCVMLTGFINWCSRFLVSSMLCIGVDKGNKCQEQGLLCADVFRSNLICALYLITFKTC